MRRCMAWQTRRYAGWPWGAVRGPLERPARLVTAVPPLADVGPDDGGSLAGGEPPDAGEELVVGNIGGRVEGGRHYLQLPVGIPVGEDDLRAGLGGDVAEEAGGRVGGRLTRVGQVARPRPAPLGDVDATQEGGNHLPELDENAVGRLPRLGEGMGPESQEEGLVG